MDPFTQFLTYAMGGYCAAYFVMKPSALAEAIGAGPGMSAAGAAWSRKHYRLTLPLTIMGLILAGHLLTQVHARETVTVPASSAERPNVAFGPVDHSKPLFQSP